MISFKKVRYKNFLSAGNQFTEIDFQKNKITLVVGKNGAGKTSFIDAICFGLYNKAFRNVNKPQLVNTITQKNTLVEIDFSINNVEYAVKRGINPPVFEIFKEGNLLDQQNTKDYQDLLEKQILKINYKTFIQIVILGSTNYIPFMKLTPDVRREIQEELLDLRIYSVMNSLLKKKIEGNKFNVRENDYQLTLIKNKIELQDSHILQLKQNNEELITDKKVKIDEIDQSMAILRQEKTTQSETLLACKQQLAARNKKAKKISEYEAVSKKLETKAGKLRTDIEFYQKNLHCPTCLQNIDDVFKMEAIKGKEDKLQEVSEAQVELSQKIGELYKSLPQIEDLNNGIITLNKKISSLNVQIETSENLIEQYEKEIEDLKKRNVDIGSQNEIRNNLELELAKYVEEQKKFSEEKEIFVAASSLLKDGGIKNKVIAQYIPLINKLINEFLSKMDFFCNFTFDENFTEHIRSRFRDEFSYESFSQGEKMRIDLSILFCWREIAKRRNSASCNLLIFDEILDGALDGDGIDDFLKILHSIITDANIFIISHKVDATDKFENVLKFVKTKNFSRIAS